METSQNPAFQIYKASAGSGKTFTLVRRYLAIVLPDPEAYKRVLAVTFTNKAANNMKGRILEALEQLRDAENNLLLELLQSDTGLDAGTIQINAGMVLSRILHDYSRFAVGTIDSFNHRLIRQFAHDLDLPGGFEVEIEQSELLNKMVDQLIDEVGRDEFVTDVLTRFAEEKLKLESGWQVERDIRKVADVIFWEEGNEDAAPVLNEFGELVEKLEAKWNEYWERMKSLADDALELIEMAGLELPDFKGGRYSVANTLFNGAARGKVPADYSKIFEKPTVLKALEHDEWFAKTSQHAELISQVLDDGLRDLALGMQNLHANGFRAAATAFTVHKHIYQFAVLKEIENLLTEYKEKNSAIPISDFNRKISEFIAQEPAEYIYWKLGERYRHYLLDEFQDTSGLQWANFLPLFDNIRSGTDEPGSILLVGDSKQAIYRWRNGKVELLEQEAPEFFGIEPDVLARNFRSDEHIVEFNNKLFEITPNFFPANELLQSVFTNATQATREDRKGHGYVQVRFLQKEEEESYRTTAIRKVLDTVNDLQVRQHDFKDIAILVRTGAEGTELARELDAAGFPVISSDSLLLGNSPTVNSLVGILKTIDDPRDKISWALLENDDNDPGTVRERVKSLSRLSARIPLYELCEEAIRMFRLNEPSNSYLPHFLDVVLEFSGQNEPDLSAFLDFWEEKKDKYALDVPESENAIRVLTVHKAKGLEFPVVILPFCNWRMGSKPGSLLWGNSEAFGGEDNFLVTTSNALRDTDFADEFEIENGRSELDNLNVLYVALTRASNEMYLFAPHTDVDKVPSPGEEVGDVAKLLAGAMQSESMLELIPETDPLVRELGLPGVGNGRGIGQEDNPEMISQSWRTRLRLRRNMNPIWDDDSTLPDGKIRQSSIVAEVFRNLKDSDSISEAVSSLEESGILLRQETSAVLPMVKEAIAAEPLASWLHPDVSARNGAEILALNGKVYTADRIVENDAEVIAIKYIATEESRKSAEKELNDFTASMAVFEDRSIKAQVVNISDLI